MFFNRTIRDMVFTSLALAGIVLLSGCGDPGRSPLVSDADVAVQKGSETAYTGSSSISFGFSPQALKRPKALGKLATAQVEIRTVSEWFYPFAGGSIEARFSDDDDDDESSSGGVRVDKVVFSVSAGSINQPVEISMTVHSGSTLDDVLIQYSPDGLHFNPPAIMRMFLKGYLSPYTVQNLKAYLISADGTVEEVPLTIQPWGPNGWRITTAVPHFTEEDLDDEGWW